MHPARFADVKAVIITVTSWISKKGRWKGNHPNTRAARTARRATAASAAACRSRFRNGFAKPFDPLSGIG